MLWFVFLQHPMVALRITNPVPIVLPCIKNQSMYLGFTGWDEYYNPTGIPDWSQINISYDSSLGNFDSNVFTAYENNGDTYV